MNPMPANVSHAARYCVAVTAGPSSAAAATAAAGAAGAGAAAGASSSHHNGGAAWYAEAERLAPSLSRIQLTAGNAAGYTEWQHRLQVRRHGMRICVVPVPNRAVARS